MFIFHSGKGQMSERKILMLMEMTKTRKGFTALNRNSFSVYVVSPGAEGGKSVESASEKKRKRIEFNFVFNYARLQPSRCAISAII